LRWRHSGEWAPDGVFDVPFRLLGLVAAVDVGDDAAHVVGVVVGVVGLLFVE
jgi:hypothetical protein